MMEIVRCLIDNDRFTWIDWLCWGELLRESERQTVILATAQALPVASVADLVEITGASEATIRRDIAALDARGALRRVRGGAKAVHVFQQGASVGRPLAIGEDMNLAQKRAIAQAASELCIEGEQVIIGGGTTTFQMMPHLVSMRMTVFTNSFLIAEYLLHNSNNHVVIPGGTIHREQNIVLSPFGGVAPSHVCARKMFMGCQGIASQGVMEGDPMIVQSELALIGQADELIVLADSSKFKARTSLIICALRDVSTVITDSGLHEQDRMMIEEIGIKLIIADQKRRTH